MVFAFFTEKASDPHLICLLVNAISFMVLLFRDKEHGQSVGDDNLDGVPAKLDFRHL